MAFGQQSHKGQRLRDWPLRGRGRWREGTKLRGRELNKEKWHVNQRAMEGHQQINETESESRQIGERARGAVKQIAPTGAQQRTKAALLLIDCRISPIFPGGTTERQWQMEADWTKRQQERRGKRGDKIEEEAGEEEEWPREAAVKLGAAIAGHNTATQSVLNRMQSSREAARGRRGDREGQEEEVRFLHQAAAWRGLDNYLFMYLID